jgi:hypothetical protein
MAPAVDYMVLLINSDTYGGAGGPYTTVAAGNFDRGLVLQHENGHTIGGLSDEYFYGPGAWPGGTVDGPNCSSYDKAEMAAQHRAWFKWLGEDDPATGGKVADFEGCAYYSSNIYRPTKNSLMRDLGFPYFNPPSAEALVLSFYLWFDPADDVPAVTPIGGMVTLPWVGDSTHLFVDWWVDGVPVAGEHGVTFDFDALTPGPGPHRVRAKVTDKTPLVRNKALRRERRRATVTFWVDESTYFCGGQVATIVGTPDPDVLIGTAGNDVIVGLDGGDTIGGLDGRDRICGGRGTDEIDGGAGMDRLYGNTGADVIRGGGNDDRLFGNGGDDYLEGEGGDDRAKGSGGTDTCLAETTETCE